MKTIRKSLIIASIIFGLSIISFGQPDPRKNGDGSAVVAGPTHGAPIGEGLFVLLTLGAGYLSGQLYRIKFNKSTE